MTEAIFILCPMEGNCTGLYAFYIPDFDGLSFELETHPVYRSA